ncbi:MAG TPA: hypothetical protein VN366_08110 [Feifaniaceae bacterium]|nr:hypothetical protein [Feifaniaceae bacterium]
MEVAGNRHKQAYTASRVYSPTRGANAYAYAPAEVAAQPAGQPKAAPKPQRRQKPKARPALSAGCKAAMLLGIFTVAAASLFVVFRYARIAGDYLEVNQMKSDMEAAQLRINALNVELECAVSIQNVQDAAARLGMTYPTADQFVRAGDALPGNGAATTAEGA